MYDYFYPDYLQHYGVKGMKWGVKKAVQIAPKIYKGLQKHGSNVMEKKASRSDFRFSYHAQKGHKIRAKYYDKQAYKTRDKSYDDIETLRASMNDLAVKSAAVMGAAKVGATVVKGILKHKANQRQIERDRKVAKAAQEALLEMYRSGKLKI